MAKRERNKRAARKARQAERERVSAAREASGIREDEESSKSLFSRSTKSSQKKPLMTVPKSERKGVVQKTVGYLADVRAEMHQVTWPTRTELRNYTVAVTIMLIVFGAVIWLVDTGFVALLVQYTGLRG